MPEFKHESEFFTNIEDHLLEALLQEVGPGVELFSSLCTESQHSVCESQKEKLPEHGCFRRSLIKGECPHTTFENCVPTTVETTVTKK